MSWLLDRPADRVTLLGLRPELAAAHERLHAAVWASGVPAEVLERCRLRMAELLAADTALAERTPGVELAPGPVDAATQAALTFTELFVVDHHRITDEQAAAVVAAFGEPGFVALTTALSVWENQHRFDIALGSL